MTVKIHYYSVISVVSVISVLYPDPAEMYISRSGLGGR
jgi:hypothetical protein